MQTARGEESDLGSFIIVLSESTLCSMTMTQLVVCPWDILGTDSWRFPVISSTIDI
jgi:hypothetical protein